MIASGFANPRVMQNAVMLNGRTPGARCHRCAQQSGAHQIVTKHHCRNASRIRATPSPDGNSSAPADQVPLGDETDVKFLAKLAGVSFGGAAAVKYGSLVFPVAFHPDAALALALVIGPPVIYAALLVLRK